MLSSSTYSICIEESREPVSLKMPEEILIMKAAIPPKNMIKRQIPKAPSLIIAAETPLPMSINEIRTA